MDKQAPSPMGTAINYIEFGANNLALVKQFYSDTFQWRFTDYGPEYTAFENSGIQGGFYLTDKSSNADLGAALVVLVCDNLVACREKVIVNGGRIKTDIFSFPGGERFHFVDPCDNELAVWCIS